MVLSQQKQHLEAISQSEELASVKHKEKDKESKCFLILPSIKLTTVLLHLSVCNSFDT